MQTNDMVQGIDTDTHAHRAGHMCRLLNLHDNIGHGKLKIEHENQRKVVKAEFRATPQQQLTPLCFWVHRRGSM
jgi:hypothetical protein